MKKKTTKIILFSLLISFGLNTIAQVAINTDGTAPDASAMLEVKSTDKGFLTPRMTQAQIEAISSPADGLIVYNTTDSHFYFYDDGAGEWKEIAISTGTITPPWTCGDAFVDARDSKSYTTVQIGTQCWMAENLNVGARINGSGDQTDNSTIEKYCYDDNTTNCDVYGGLYQWDEMMQYVTTEGTQGICPTDWHLPTDAEWCTLENHVDAGTILCWVYGWSGTDASGNLKESGTTHWSTPNTGATNSSGFTALPGGRTDHAGGFGYLTVGAEFWASNGNVYTERYCLTLKYDNAQVYRGMHHKDYGHSVRCIKD